ncbi:MAG: hypothetical protein HY661_11175 [Betaproteobacteria bacterium]|nr:hypothetical protein [Betaproteobacteria bacterium]
MSTWIADDHPLMIELKEIAPFLLPFVEPRNSAALLLEELPRRYTPASVARVGLEQRAWEVAGLLHLNTRRVQEALAIFWSMYQQMLSAQDGGQYVHKGLPLVWIADCFAALGFPVHAKRYYMLTLCEDALHGGGMVSPQDTGIYFRLAWGRLSDAELRRYARLFHSLGQTYRDERLFPEALLQRVDQRWLTEFPSASEASSYWTNPKYAQHLLAKLGDGSGEHLELLAEYLMSCMPGCRTMRRKRSRSTDYDVVCSMEGFEVDFRSELGRYFVCECKDWKNRADFSTMAKFCRVLESIKSKFGVLFSKQGLSGAGRTSDGEREQLKVFHEHGMVIVVVAIDDLEAVANGANFIQILRERYEAVRLDLGGDAPTMSPSKKTVGKRITRK